MKAEKRRNIVIIALISLLIVLIFMLWFNREKLIWWETVTVIKKACYVDLEKLEVEYEYENTLRRFYEEPRHGSILVSFTCSPEYAEEVLFKYKDRLREHMEYDEGEKLTKELKFMEDSSRGMMALAIGVPKEDLKGKSLRTGFAYQRPFNLSKQKCKCMSTDYIHVQELDNGDVTVYIYYYE